MTTEALLSETKRKIRFHVLTLFPELIEHASSFGVVGQAMKTGEVSVKTLNPRSFTTNVHQTVDDRPFGGGDGMIMLAEPLALAMESLLGQLWVQSQARPRVIHLSPRGVPFDDSLARELSQESDLILIASRYGGVDQRFLNRFVTDEVSVGDYVLSGGELPALILIDSISRHLPGVLGNETSADEESFSPSGIGLEHPQYSRPREWRGEDVPEALLSGHHLRIREWKEIVSLFVTLERRPDLIDKVALQARGKLLKAAKQYLAELSDPELTRLGLRSRALIAQRLSEVSP